MVLPPRDLIKCDFFINEKIYTDFKVGMSKQFYVETLYEQTGYCFSIPITGESETNNKGIFQ